MPDGPIRLYVCGVTPYDTTHLGHAFTFLHFDVLVRALRWLGREVSYVQNVTDVDDSILQRARKLGVGWRELGDAQTTQYLADMRSLNVQPPTHLIRATDVVPTIHDLVKHLLDKGSAYAAGDTTGQSVYFRIASSPHYGELSKLSRSEMIAITAQQDDGDMDNPYKEDPLDFVLWKGWSGEPDEPHWESPWGRGRPGWNIECSAMSYQTLGPSVTIHGGGADLIYPHHEAEIAQSETATGVRPFARTWMHTAMVRMHGEKMSKSRGNMVFVRDLVRQYSADSLRVYLLEHHYRDVWEWSSAQLQATAARAERLALAAEQGATDSAAQRVAFRSALEDDLNTPRALDVLDEVSGPPLRELAGVLGLTLTGPAPR